MLSPRAIATLGIGYAPAVAARLGLWPVESAVSADRRARVCVRDRALTLVTVHDLCGG